MANTANASEATLPYLDCLPDLLPVDRPQGFPHIINKESPTFRSMDPVNSRIIHVADTIATAVYHINPTFLHKFFDLNIERVNLYYRYEGTMVNDCRMVWTLRRIKSEVYSWAYSEPRKDKDSGKPKNGCEFIYTIEPPGNWARVEAPHSGLRRSKAHSEDKRDAMINTVLDGEIFQAKTVDYMSEQFADPQWVGEIKISVGVDDDSATRNLFRY